MQRVLARTGIIAVLMAFTAVMTGSLPAYAIMEGSLITTIYYSNAQHSQVVGEYFVGNCPHGPNSGSQTAYYKIGVTTCWIG
jgi:hypothetical protein